MNESAIMKQKIHELPKKPVSIGNRLIFLLTKPETARSKKGISTPISFQKIPFFKRIREGEEKYNR